MIDIPVFPVTSLTAWSILTFIYVRAFFMCSIAVDA